MVNVDLNEEFVEEIDYSSSDDNGDEFKLSFNESRMKEEEGESESDSEEEKVEGSDNEMDLSRLVGGEGGNWNFISKCPLDELLERKEPANIIEDDVLGLEFGSVEAAEVMYRKYSLFIGFGVRKDDMMKDGNGFVLNRRWVCNRAGFRSKRNGDQGRNKRKPRPKTRVGCYALMRVKYTVEKEKYVLDKFCPIHNHALVSPYQLQFIRSNRKVTAAALATAIALRRVGIRTSQIMDLMVSQCDGFSDVGYTKKDLQNALNRQCYREIETSDAETALAYLRAKGQMDNGLFVRYGVDERQKLRNLFWCDSGCRYDYACFGDVVGFDATYNKNKYRKPVVLMIGSNNHWRTTIYGVAMLANETFETYVWLLNTFNDAMNQKIPITVITDEDKAMRAAVRHVFPSAHHRLCSWHLARNSQTYVGKSEFTAAFTSLMYADVGISDWENRWNDLVQKFGVGNNRWVKRMYRLRSMWATSYLRGTFFAGMRTTQRCESLNGVLKTFLKSRFKVYQFVEEMDSVFRRIRNNELGDDYKSRHADQVLSTHLIPFERHASQIYTVELFIMVRDEIIDEHDLVVQSFLIRVESQFYSVKKYLRPEKEWRVVFRRFDMYIQCSCKKFESELIPCYHIFAVLKFNHLDRIPDSLISKRWTKKAKPEVDFEVFAFSQGSSSVKERAMFATLSMMGNRICSSAAKDRRRYEKVAKTFMSLLEDIENEAEPDPVQQSTWQRNMSGTFPDVVLDAEVCKSKGAPKKSKSSGARQYKCGRCKCFGHNSRNCPKDMGKRHMQPGLRFRVEEDAANIAGPSRVVDLDSSCDLTI